MYQKKYDFENLSHEDIVQLIEDKLEKEANRYIQQWEDEKISIENGRWGAFIKFKKANIKIPKRKMARNTPTKNLPKFPLMR